MKPDVFGDLRDWGRVLSMLGLLAEKKRLDEVQPGLVRILKYRDNWRLRERALLYARDIRYPSDQLLLAALDVVCDRKTYLDARILAAQTLAHLAPRVGGTGRKGEVDTAFVLHVLSSLLGTPEPPILHQAIEKAMRSIADTGHHLEAEQKQQLR